VANYQKVIATMMPLHRWCPVLIPVVVLAWLATGCSSPRRGEPLAGPMTITVPEIKKGQKVFMKNCQQCHPGGEAGLGPALNNKPLPAFLIRAQVRHGFGAMPAFPEQEISEEELTHLLGYLKELKQHG
jgi:mono/diheme cytochrome c family protein